MAAPTPPNPTLCGCFCTNSRKPVPLKDIIVEATIKGFTANVTSRLCYENNEDCPIEAEFVFPMDSECAVYGFEAEIEGRRIKAEVMGKEEAQETYDDATERGHTAFLLEEKADDVFSCSLGNLPARTKAQLTLSYALELPLAADGGVNFCLPTVLNPRYNPSVEDGGVARPPKPLMVPPNAIPYSFDITVKIDGTKPVANITSKDKISTKYLDDEKSKAEVSLVEPLIHDHDVEMTVYYHQPYTPSAVLARGDPSQNGLLKNDVVMLNFFPELKDDDFSTKKEFIFIVDRSGSMGGGRIERAKESLLLFLKSLPSDCYFNIISFGSRHTLLFQNGSEKYSDETLARALELQQYMEADYGGTEILRPLKDVYSKPLIEGYSRQLFVLTDGAVSNAPEVTKTAAANAANARVFTLGIGEGASTALVKGLAAAGKGKPIFVNDSERLQPQVMKCLKWAMQKAVTDVDVTSGLPLRFFPHPPPPVYAGEKLVLYGVSKESGPLDGSIALTGKLDGRTLKYDMPVKPEVVITDPTFALHRLAAKAQIEHLEQAEKDESTLIKLLSTSANVASSVTSMVGVDLAGKVTTTMRTRQVPVPSVYGGRGRRRRGLMGANAHMLMKSAAPIPAHAMPMSAPGPMAQCAQGNFRILCALDTRRPLKKMAAKSKSKGPGGVGGHGGRGSRGGGGGSPPLHAQASFASSGKECDVAQPPAPAPESGYMRLVSLQHFTGRWHLDRRLAEVLGSAGEEQLKADAPVQDDDLLGTALALTFLEMQHNDEMAEWEMVALKARQWLEQQGADVTELMAWAKTRLKK